MSLGVIIDFATRKIGQGHCVEVVARSCVTSLKGCVMSGRVNWTRLNSRNRMRRQGVEDIKGKTPLVGQTPKNSLAAN